MSKWIGDFGEGVAKALLERRGYRVLALQNRSGNGIDLVAVKRARGQWVLLVAEIKATGTTRSPSLRGSQADLGNWARSRLEMAANGRGAYTNLSPSARKLARKMLALTRNGMPAAVVKIDVLDVGKGPVRVRLGGSTHLPRAPVKPTGRKQLAKPQRPRARVRP